MNWIAFFSVLLGVPTVLTACYGLVLLMERADEHCPWWTFPALWLVVVATLIGLVL